MIGAGNSFWGSAVNYLRGNAKVYDGSFDYDTISPVPAPSAFIDKSTAFSIALAFFTPAGSGQARTIYTVGDPYTSGARGFAVVRRYGPSSVLLVINNGAAAPLQISATGLADGYNVICIQKAAGLDFSAANMQCTINSVAQSFATIIGANITTNFPSYTAAHKIGERAAGGFRFIGNLKTLEIINRVATAGEISALMTTGSFRGAGIAHSSGQYLLAVDFDKTGTVSPTTFTSTPSYTITSLGGAAYTPYL